MLLNMFDWKTRVPIYDNLIEHADCWYSWLQRNFEAINANKFASFSVNGWSWPDPMSIISVNKDLDIAPTGPETELNRFLCFNQGITRCKPALWTKLYYESIYKAISDGVAVDDIRWTFIRDSICELASISYAMTYVINKTWLPIQSRGQGFDYDVHKQQADFRQFCTDLSNSLREEYIEECEYDAENPPENS